jgi:hypothetical protein
LPGDPQEFHVELVEWCREERANALKTIEIIASGKFRMGDDRFGSIFRDYTSALRATYERIVEQMDHLSKEYGPSNACDPKDGVN